MIRSSFLQPTIAQTLGIARRVLGYFSRASLRDWQYVREHVLDELTTLARTGSLPALQMANGDAAFVSTPVDGIGAGLAADGRLTTLTGPHTGFTHQLPTFWSVDGTAPVVQPDPLAGSFAGVALDGASAQRRDGDGTGAGATTWLTAPAFETDISYRTATGMVDLSYAGAGLSVAETTYVPPESGTVVRDYVVENTGEHRRSGSFVYHTRANVNDNQQTFVVWNSSPNALAAENRPDADSEVGAALTWTDLAGPYALRVSIDASTARAVPLGECSGRPTDDGGPTADGRVEGRYLDGRLVAPLDLAPGERRRFSVAIACGESPATSPLSAPAGERQAAAATWWREWLDDTDRDGVDARFLELYERSLISMGMLSDPTTGALPAAPNLQPMYHPTWIRDGAFVAVALARAGKTGPAKRFLAEFCPRVVREDGAFEQCYDARGASAGIIPVEGDQQPLYAWAVAAVYRETGDAEFLARAWPTVAAALAYTRETVGEDGLLAPTPDIAEYPRDVRQSLWTNSFAYAGLAAGASLATELADLATGEASEPAPDRERAVATVGGRARQADGGTSLATPATYRRTAERCRGAAAALGAALRREFFVDGEAFLSHRDLFGDSSHRHLYNAVAYWPTGWAERFGVDDRVLAAVRERIHHNGHAWIPGALLAVGALYAAGDAPAADDLLAAVAEERTPAGHLVEMPGDGSDHYFASPLSWSHAAFVLAVQARRRARRDRPAPSDGGDPTGH